MSLIKVNNCSFSYDRSVESIFDHASFQIDTNWKLGFIARNGKGKTTFLKMLMGQLEYQGEIRSDAGFAYFPYVVDDKTLITRHVIGHLKEHYEEWELVRELNLLQVSEEVLERPFDSLSQGEQTKVLLAVLFLNEHAFLLIDEVTNHLDVQARHVVAEYLNNKKGFILVSHDRAFMDRCINHVLVINRSNIEVLNGNFSSWWINKQIQDQSEIKQNEIIKKDMRRLKEAARRVATFSDKTESQKFGNGPVDRGFLGHKAAKVMKRSKSIEARHEKALENKSKLLKNIESNETLKLSVLPFPSKKLAYGENICLYYGEHQVCEPFDFEINKHDRIALSGINGCGKTTLIKLLNGEEIEFTGDVFVAKSLKISYLSQDTSFLKGSLDDFVNEYGLDMSLFKAILRKLDFERSHFEKDMVEYSDGQKKKVLLAKSLSEEAHLYIWDEPLNYIDVFSRIQIEELLLSFQPTLLFVEHDETFSDKIATKKVEIIKYK